MKGHGGGLESVAGSYEVDSETSGFIRCWNILIADKPLVSLLRARQQSTQIATCESKHVQASLVGFCPCNAYNYHVPSRTLFSSYVSQNYAERMRPIITLRTDQNARCEKTRSN
jgi:uncharacterized protein YfaT (DUF1175 family)